MVGAEVQKILDFENLILKEMFVENLSSQS